MKFFASILIKRQPTVQSSGQNNIKFQVQTCKMQSADILSIMLFLCHPLMSIDTITFVTACQNQVNTSGSGHNHQKDTDFHQSWSMITGDYHCNVSVSFDLESLNPSILLSTFHYHSHHLVKTTTKSLA